MFPQLNYWQSLPDAAELHFGAGLRLVYRPDEKDPCVAVVGGYHQESRTLYLVHLVAEHVGVTSFKPLLAEANLKHPGIPWFLDCHVSEGSLVHLLSTRATQKDFALDIVPDTSSEDVFSRYLLYSEAWQQGRVLVPSPEFIQATGAERAWDEIIRGHLSFGGVRPGRGEYHVNAAATLFRGFTEPALSQQVRGAKIEVQLPRVLVNGQEAEQVLGASGSAQLQAKIAAAAESLTRQALARK